MIVELKNYLNKVFGKKIFTFRICDNDRTELYQIIARTQKEAWSKMDKIHDPSDTSVDIQLTRVQRY